MNNKMRYDSIVNPFPGDNPPDPGDFSVMVSQESDLRFLCYILGIDKKKIKKRMMMSRLYAGDGRFSNFSLIGPVVGASYAAILLETLIVWGARSFLFFGYCGAVSGDAKIGDIIVPTSSIVDEGVSKHYNLDLLWENNDNEISYPSLHIVNKTKAALNDRSLCFKEGIIWTTDAIFRETKEKVEYYQKKNVSGVEMETSALFTVGKFRNVDIGSVLVVSDDLSDYTWHTGFSDKRFKKSCRDVCEAIAMLCKK